MATPGSCGTRVRCLCDLALGLAASSGARRSSASYPHPHPRTRYNIQSNAHVSVTTHKSCNFKALRSNARVTLSNGLIRCGGAVL